MKPFKFISTLLIGIVVLKDLQKMFFDYRNNLVKNAFLVGRRSLFDTECSTEDQPCYMQDWFDGAEHAMTMLGHSIIQSEEECMKPEMVESFVLTACRGLITAVDEAREATLHEMGKVHRRLTPNPFL